MTSPSRGRLRQAPQPARMGFAESCRGTRPSAARRAKRRRIAPRRATSLHALPRPAALPRRPIYRNIAILLLDRLMAIILYVACGCFGDAESGLRVPVERDRSLLPAHDGRFVAPFGIRVLCPPRQRSVAGTVRELSSVGPSWICDVPFSGPRFAAIWVEDRALLLDVGPEFAPPQRGRAVLRKASRRPASNGRAQRRRAA